MELIDGHVYSDGLLLYVAVKPEPDNPNVLPSRPGTRGGAVLGLIGVITKENIVGISTAAVVALLHHQNYARYDHISSQ